MEKERQELMEQKKLSRERAKRRKTGRMIAARIAVCEMDKWRRTQARKRLQCYRRCSRLQTAQYQEELREMKERVAQSPFLFEQAIQNNVRGTVNRLFTKVLQSLRLDEELACGSGPAGGRTGPQLGEPETGDWEGVRAPSQSERRRFRSACEESSSDTSAADEGDGADPPWTEPAAEEC
ncbi:testis-specific protein 10-interacting protein-like [Scyliorhinus torazame]|uniref:testis-specific protein 10-interacting protein-like n=1 Tax=Scyliorhinus torazame TaxID=75743 RepID=UPI003B59D880